MAPRYQRVATVFLRGSEFSIEGLCGLDDGIHDGDEFADAGDDGLLVGFALGAQAGIEGLEQRITAIAGLGGHIEGLAKGRTSALDVTLAFAASRIGIEGSHSDEGLEDAGGALTELGQLGDNGSTGRCGDAWNALQQVAALTHGLASGDLLGNRVLDAFDLLVEGLDHALDTGLDVLLEDHAEVIFLGNASIDELAATQGKCLQTGLLCARQGGDARPGPLAEGGQHAGIDGIGFWPAGRCLWRNAGPGGDLRARPARPRRPAPPWRSAHSHRLPR